MNVNICWLIDLNWTSKSDKLLRSANHIRHTIEKSAVLEQGKLNKNRLPENTD